MWNVGLNSIGVTSTVGSTNLIPTPLNYSVVSLLEIQNQNIDMVRVLKRSAGRTLSSGFIRLEFVELIVKTGLVDIGISRTKKSRTFPFWGKIIGFRWSGGRLASRLNDDTELNQGLSKCLGGPSKVNIGILPQAIHGYLAIIIPSMPPTRELWDYYDRIARYIREEVASVERKYQVSKQ